MSQETKQTEGTRSPVKDLLRSPHSDSSQSRMCTSTQQHATPSSSGGVLKPIIFNSNNEAILAKDKDLPSQNIAELWHKPLKIDISSQSTRKSLTPKENIPSKSGSTDRITPGFKKRNMSPFKLYERSAGSGGIGGKPQRSRYRKSLSMPDPTSSPHSTPIPNPKRMKLFMNNISPYQELNECKKEVNAGNSSSLTPAVKKLFLKSHSDTILSSSSIITALDKIQENPDLIGDYSKCHILPLKPVGNLHPELKEISTETLAELMEQKGEWGKSVSFKIIDCRYPYEYDGGHIRGAINIFTKTQIQEELLDVKTSYEKALIPENVREILIFHCEFSSKRGPILWRYLRDIDRLNSNYPTLLYPELYLLFGGYKEFFAKYPTLCEPNGYISMSDPEFSDSYKRYRSVTKLT